MFDTSVTKSTDTALIKLMVWWLHAGLRVAKLYKRKAISRDVFLIKVFRAVTIKQYVLSGPSTCALQKILVCKDQKSTQTSLNKRDPCNPHRQRSSRNIIQLGLRLIKYQSIAPMNLPHFGFLLDLPMASLLFFLLIWSNIPTTYDS